MFSQFNVKEKIQFSEGQITKQLLAETPEMRVALICLGPGQKMTPHKAPVRLLMYCVEGKGTILVGDNERVPATEGTAVVCDPMVMHGFEADEKEPLVIMAVVTAVE
ncbi:MAG: cupin domain-containing protein [Nitrospirae bacterium]|nr:MAG: cupin domain-containing protein [Nitrospirota bacterium]